MEQRMILKVLLLLVLGLSLAVNGKFVKIAETVYMELASLILIWSLLACVYSCAMSEEPVNWWLIDESINLSPNWITLVRLCELRVVKHFFESVTFVMESSSHFGQSHICSRTSLARSNRTKRGTLHMHSWLTKRPAFFLWIECVRFFSHSLNTMIDDIKRAVFEIHFKRAATPKL